MDNFLKISEFAALSGISRKLLIFYDNTGILHPKYTDPENGYRYYSYRQIDTANAIVSFREAGMSLESIRRYLSERSPKHLLETLDTQEDSLNRQIQKLERIKSMVQARRMQTIHGINTPIGEILIKEFASENLFLGPELPEDYKLEEGWHYLPAFYDACVKNGIQIGFTVGTLVDLQNLRKGLWQNPSRYFYRLPSGQYPDFYTFPAGLYVVGTELTDYGHTDSLYKKMFSYINRHKLKICGNAYEEYLIDELSEECPDHYLLQIIIQIDDC